MARMLLFLIFALAFATPDSKGKDFWRFSSMQTAVRQNDSAACDLGFIRFNSDMLEKIPDLYHDLRIADGDGREVPFVVIQETQPGTDMKRMEVAAELLALEQDGNSISLTLRQTGKELSSVSELVLNTANRNFEKKLAIYVSSDGKSWRQIADGLAFFDYSRIVDLSRNRVEFPAQTERYFKVVVDNFKEKSESPFSQLVSENREGMDFSRKRISQEWNAGIKIDKVILFSKVAGILPVSRSYPLTVLSINSEKAFTHILLKSRNEPLTTFELSCADNNFSRKVTVSRLNANGTWQSIASGLFENIDVKGFKRLERRVKFPASRAVDYKISIFNGDNLPLDNISVKAYGTSYCAEFIDIQSPWLTVYYGGKAPAPAYDLKAVIARLSNPELVEYVAGGEQLNPLFRREEWKFDGSVVFIVSIVLIALVLGLILLKNIKHLGPEKSEMDKD
jgi:hypothetical protein